MLVLQNLGLSWYPRWHYAVVSGYRADTQSIQFQTGWEQPRQIAVETFAKTWQRADNWAAVVLNVGEFPADNNALKYLQALMRLQLSKPSNTIMSEGYRRAVAQWPDYLPLRLALANWYQELGELAEAETTLRQLLAINADYAPANNNLALLLLRAGRAQDAQTYSERALRHGSPQFIPHYRDTQRQIENALRH